MDGNGVLDKEELIEGFRHRGIRFEGSTIDNLMKVADLNSDGVISFEEFEVMMTGLKRDANYRKIWKKCPSAGPFGSILEARAARLAEERAKSKS